MANEFKNAFTGILPGGAAKNIADRDLEAYEKWLAKANLKWTKRIILLDYADRKMLAGRTSHKAEIKITSGLWIDYESKRVAVRNTAATTLVGGVGNRWAEALGKKKEEIPEIVPFSDIQSFEIIEEKASDSTDFLSLHINTSGKYCARVLIVDLLQKSKAIGGLGAMTVSSLKIESSEYQNCRNCIGIMADELDNIMRMGKPEAALVEQPTLQTQAQINQGTNSVARQHFNNAGELQDLQTQPSAHPQQQLQQQAKFCSSCGVKLSIESAFCTGCGAKQ